MSWATLGIILSTTGCFTPTLPGNMTDRLPRPGAKVVIGTVSNATLHPFRTDVESGLRKAVEKELQERDLLASDPPETGDFLLNITIAGIRAGDDGILQLILPGASTGVAEVSLELLELDGTTLVAELYQERIVAAGAGYSVANEHQAISDIAGDLAHDLAIRIAKGGDFVVEAVLRRKVPAGSPPRSGLSSVRVEEVRDMRPITGYIGNRQAAFGVSMGEVYFSRQVPQFIRETLQLELAAAGYRIGEEEGGVRLACDLNRFWLHTDATALYWDIVAEISITLSRPARDPVWEKEYSATATQRTFVYPSSSLCGKVIGDCLDDLMKQLVEDESWH